MKNNQDSKSTFEKVDVDELLVIKALPHGNIEYPFYSMELEQQYLHALHKHLSFYYLLMRNNVIISFAFFMDESTNLVLGFLEYQVFDQGKRSSLSKKFPALSKKTLYLNYIYTDHLFRSQHLTTWFIRQVISKEKLIFDYIWLRRETSSNLFDQCGFMNFRSAVEKIIGPANFKEYFNDNKAPALMSGNIEFMVNI